VRWVWLGAAIVVAIGARVAFERSRSARRLEVAQQELVSRSKKAADDARQPALDQAMRERLRRQLEMERGPEPDAPEPTPVELGPAADADQGARKATALDVLAGREPAAQFPLRASDAGETFDYGLRDTLAPVRFTKRQVPASRGGDCVCTPGDPLCSCY